MVQTRAPAPHLQWRGRVVNIQKASVSFNPQQGQLLKPENTEKMCDGDKLCGWGGVSLTSVFLPPFLCYTSKHENQSTNLTTVIRAG